MSKEKKQQYFLHVAYTYQAKNKLQLAAVKLFQELDGSLIDDLDEIHNWLKTEIEELNIKYPKCTKLDYKLGHRDGKTKAVEGVEAVSVYFYPVLKRF